MAPSFFNQELDGGPHWRQDLLPEKALVNIWKSPGLAQAPGDLHRTLEQAERSLVPLAPTKLL